jgi:AraC-like DNA-binding protein
VDYQTPMAYLTRWRLQLAAQTLASTSYSVAQVASEVGYESEAAFNRAFKREFEVPPARFRSQLRSGRELPDKVENPKLKGHSTDS